MLDTDQEACPTSLTLERNQEDSICIPLTKGHPPKMLVLLYSAHSWSECCIATDRILSQSAVP